MLTIGKLSLSKVSQMIKVDLLWEKLDYYTVHTYYIYHIASLLRFTTVIKSFDY